MRKNYPVNRVNMGIRTSLCLVLFCIFLACGCKESTPLPGPGSVETVTWGGPFSDRVSSVAVDGNDNVYVVGRFTGTVDFDPGFGQEFHTFTQEYGIFLSKFDSLLQFQWVQVWGPASFRIACKTDYQGNIYVAGDFFDEADFDPDPHVDDLRDTDTGMGYLMKFDGLGNREWVETWGSGVFRERMYSCNNLAVDESGVYLSGEYSIYSQHEPSGEFAYLLRFDSGGNLLWERVWGDGSMGDIDVVSDNWGNAFVSGTFKTEVDFDPGTDIVTRSASNRDGCFITCFDSDGTFQWVQTWNGSRGNHSAISGLCLGENETLYITGHFNQTLEFSEPDETITGSAKGAYLAEFDTDGNRNWVITWDGNVSTLVVTPESNIAVIGIYGPGSDLDPDPEEMSFDQYGSYLSIFDPSGNLLSLRTWDMGNPGNLAVDSTGIIWASGSYSADSLGLPPTSDPDTVEFFGAWDAFLTKFLPSE